MFDSYLARKADPMIRNLYTADQIDQAHAAVMARHPELTGEAFDRKVRRVLAIMAHVNDGPTWTAKA